MPPTTTYTSAGRSLSADYVVDAFVLGQTDPTGIVGLKSTDLEDWGSASSPRDFKVTKNAQELDHLRIWGNLDLGSFSDTDGSALHVLGTTARGKLTSAITAANDNARGAHFTDSLFAQRPDQHNEWCGLIRAGGFTMERCEGRGFPDFFAVVSTVGNWELNSSWMHDGWYNEWTAADVTSGYMPDSSGSQKYTHCDIIQPPRGRNIRIIGNALGGKRAGDFAHNASPSQKDKINSGDDAYNSVLMAKQEKGGSVYNEALEKVENVLFDQNWCRGGQATINLSYNLGNKLETFTISRNRFDRSGKYQILRDFVGGVGIGNITPDNVYEDDGSPVKITSGTRWAA